jgi:hyperosmotically inducible protein
LPGSALTCSASIFLPININKEQHMQTPRLIAVLTAALIATGCAGMKENADTSKASQQGAGQAMDDSAITARAKGALQADPELNAVKIDVSTSAGVVKLKGDIKSLALRRKAEALVKAVPGVKSIDNQMIITG